MLFFRGILGIRFISGSILFLVIMFFFHIFTSLVFILRRALYPGLISPICIFSCGSVVAAWIILYIVVLLVPRVGCLAL